MLCSSGSRKRTSTCSILLLVSYIVYRKRSLTISRKTLNEIMIHRPIISPLIMHIIYEERFLKQFSHLLWIPVRMFSLFKKEVSTSMCCDGTLGFSDRALKNCSEIIYGFILFNIFIDSIL